jgi:hypothetical protein
LICIGRLAKNHNDLNKNGLKRSIFLFSQFSSFAFVTSSKNVGLVGKFDFRFSEWSISRLYEEKAQENTRYAGALPNFELDDLLNKVTKVTVALLGEYALIVSKSRFWMENIVMLTNNVIGKSLENHED